MATIKLNGLRFGRHGIRNARGQYFPCWYHRHQMVSAGQEVVTVSAKGGGSLPAELSPTNGTDITTDYFEPDRARFPRGTREFDALLPLTIHAA